MTQFSAKWAFRIYGRIHSIALRCVIMMLLPNLFPVQMFLEYRWKFTSCLSASLLWSKDKEFGLSLVRACKLSATVNKLLCCLEMFHVFFIHHNMYLRLRICVTRFPVSGRHWNRQFFDREHLVPVFGIYPILHIYNIVGVFSGLN